MRLSLSESEQQALLKLLDDHGSPELMGLGERIRGHNPRSAAASRLQRGIAGGYLSEDHGWHLTREEGEWSIEPLQLLDRYRRELLRESGLEGKRFSTLKAAREALQALQAMEQSDLPSDLPEVDMIPVRGVTGTVSGCYKTADGRFTARRRAGQLWKLGSEREMDIEVLIQHHGLPRRSWPSLQALKRDLSASLYRKSLKTCDQR